MNCDAVLQFLERLVPECQRPIREEGKKCSPVPQWARYRRCRDARDERVRRDANQCRVGTNLVSKTAERGRHPVSGSPGSPWCRPKHAYWPKANATAREVFRVRHIPHFKTTEKSLPEQMLSENLACPHGVDAFPLAVHWPTSVYVTQGQFPRPSPGGRGHPFR